MREHTTNVVTSSTLFELAENLKVFLKEIEHHPKPQLIFRKLRNELLSRCSAILFDEPIVITGSAAIPFYLENYWIYSKSAKTNTSRLSTLATEIFSTFTPSSQDSIPEQTIHTMLDLVNSKYSLSQALQSQGFFYILSLEAQHRTWNSLHSGTAYENGMVKSYIMLTSPHKNARASHEAIILHELGHALHTMVTRQPITVPDAFAELFRPYSPALTPLEESELFAECFTLAALYNSPYEDFSFWKDIPADALNALSAYMKALANATLSGAVYEIYDAQGRFVERVVADGRTARSSLLVLGTYTLYETQPPKGYNLNTLPMTVTGDFDGQTLEVGRADTGIADNVIMAQVALSKFADAPLTGDGNDGGVKLPLEGIEFTFTLVSSGAVACTMRSYAGMDVDAIKKSASEWEEKAKAAEKRAKADVEALRFENALIQELVDAGAKNPKAVRALLNADDLKRGEDGKIAGLTEQLEAVRKDNDYMFHIKPAGGAGFDGKNPASTENMSVEAAIMAEMFPDD